MAIIIAGERSGVGKTTVTLSLLCFLTHKSKKVQSFKVGPDYIDPMFHTAITGRPCRNLDPILTSEAYVKSCFARHCQGVNYALVEGVMGLFDGITSPFECGKEAENEGRPPINDYASTAHIARLLNLPVVLVIDCSRLSGSVAAITSGYRHLDPRLNLAGVILNRVGSDRHLYLLQEALEPLKLPVLGVLRRNDDIIIPDRHLGLVPSSELSHLSSLFDQLTHLATTSFNWEQLLPLLKTSSSSPLPSSRFVEGESNSSRIKIALAQDRAFNFYYPDNLEILEQFGAQLIRWSPMEDSDLPEGTQGLYFGGGFPEVFAQQLAENIAAQKAVTQAILRGMPTIAECGGLMYLCEQLVDFAGQTWPMVGILPTTAVMSSTLTLGYRQATAKFESLLLKGGETLWGHEFHRSKLTVSPMYNAHLSISILASSVEKWQEVREVHPFSHPLFEIKQFYQASSVSFEGWNFKKLHASYIHLHFGESQFLPARFLARCLDFSF